MLVIQQYMFIKYKLIHTQTKEETICDKVVVDGFDYYVSDENISKSDWFISLPRQTIHKCTHIFENNIIDNNYSNRENVEIVKFDCKKAIVTNNPKIDLPKVVDEVEDKAKEIKQMYGIDSEYLFF